MKVKVDSNTNISKLKVQNKSPQVTNHRAIQEKDVVDTDEEEHLLQDENDAEEEAISLAMHKIIEEDNEVDDILPQLNIITSSSISPPPITFTSTTSRNNLNVSVDHLKDFSFKRLNSLVSMECMQTGVPTLTTPTLTPTTLRSIEESFIQLTSEPINAPYQAGFIPPPLGSYNPTTTTNSNNTTNNNNNNANATTLTSVNLPGGSNLTTAALNNIYLGDISGGASVNDYGNTNDSGTEENSQESWNEHNLHEDNSMATTDNSSAATDTISFQNGLGMSSHLNNSNSSTTNDFTTVNLTALAMATAAAKMSNSANLNSNTSSTSATKNTSTTTTTTRRGGGRRPATNASLTPEEEEKRRVRRERNKLAAARCRKRRVDQTNELTEEVALLEKKREELQKQIESLNGTKQELEFILEAHRTSCQMNPDMLSVNSLSGLMPNAAGDNDNITGLDTTLSSTARSNSPLDLKPVLNDQLLAQIKPEPLDSTLDSNSSLDGPPSPKKMLLTNNNPMIPPPLPNVATLSASLAAAASSSLNTPIVTTAPISFGSVLSNNSVLQTTLIKPNSKQRPNSLPTVPRNMAQNLALNMADNKPPTDINGVAIQTPSTGMFNFDSLMDGGTGLTPVSGPLVPTCSSQNKHPLELVTPTSEPSKLVSL
ncbi:transcription factor kayak isoform X4 [Musca autumnalis]|uniref:transcription factor kayak isoform X4 n=1 Tax=Musca autumnalis TaxID=221902 RepID=UPI003CED0ED2